VKKFLATETAANASAERSACNGDDSDEVTGMGATVSSESCCPSNDKDDSDSESWEHYVASTFKVHQGIGKL
jgi:hypothetical protein